MGVDALHIACAEKSKSDFSVTCDDILVKKCKTNEKIIKFKVETLMKLDILRGIRFYKWEIKYLKRKLRD